jgi:EmrB/QacA subfamily drug resistance transporter
MIARKGRKAIIAAILLTLFLSALDQTIVGTALPRIVADLAGLHLYAWVFTAYMLAYAVAVPIGGKLGDLLGRKVMMLAGISLFLAASALGGLARSMEVLVLARGLQGLGGGCISATSSALVGDLFPPSERGRYTGLFSGVYALASVVGPLLGGLVVDHWNWRGIFLINLPLGLVAIGVLARLPVTAPRRGRSLDWLGALALMGVIVPLMLAVPARKGSAEHAVPSVQWLPLLVGVLMLGVFVLVERRAREPIVPLVLFRQPVFSLCIATVFISGPALYVGGVFIPLFMQDVLHSSASAAGMVMMPMMLLLVVGSIIGGQWVSRTGVYRWLSVCGLALSTAGMFALSRLSPSTTPSFIMAALALIGFGYGLTLPTLALAAQNAVEHRHLGVSTSLPSFVRSLSGTLGVALFGALMTRRLHEGLAPAVAQVFLVATGVLATATVMGFFLQDLPLRRTNEEPEEAGAVSREGQA